MKRRIALISEHASPISVLGGVDNGGQNVYVGQLAKHLGTLGYDVDIFTRRDNEFLPEVVDWARGVRIIYVPAGLPQHIRKEQLLPYMNEFTAYLIRFFKEQAQPYDLVHANFWMSALVGADIKRELGVPLVVTFHALGRVRRIHQGKADEFPEDRFMVEDRVVMEADHVIAECPQDEEDLIRLYNADPSHITLIPCGFDPGEMEPVNKTLARIALGLSPRDNIILQLGRMVPRKGVDNVVRGVARLIKEYGVPARLLIVGGESDDPDPRLTPEIGRLQALAGKEDIADHVTFVGSRGREVLKYYYSAADLFVTTPWYEPFGITPVEAMACGTPVIGSNVGGIKFSVRDGETGYLVPPNDPQALAERMSYLYQNPSLLNVLGRRAISRANALFTWHKVATDVAALYEQVLAAAQPRRSEEVDQLARIDRNFSAGIEALHQSRRLLPSAILEIARAISTCFAQGGKVLVCGNGGSAADAQHFAAELVGRFKNSERPALPVIALNADTSILTAWANDIGYDKVFARQVEAYGKPGDLLMVISTSGKSRNLIEALVTAHRYGIGCIGILGRDGGDALQHSDLPVVVPASDSQRIQETQILILHILAELVEEQFLSNRRVRWADAETGQPIWTALDGFRAAAAGASAGAAGSAAQNDSGLSTEWDDGRMLRTES